MALPLEAEVDMARVLGAEADMALPLVAEADMPPTLGADADMPPPRGKRRFSVQLSINSFWTPPKYILKRIILGGHKNTYENQQFCTLPKNI